MTDGLKFQTIQLQTGPLPTAGPSARGAAIGAGVELLHKASTALNGWSVSWRVNREIEKRKDQIEAAIARHEEHLRRCDPNTGVLIVVALQEWAQPDPTGTRAQSFLSMHLGGVGTSYREVLQRYRSQDHLLPGPARGWRKKDVFIWATRG